LRAGGGGKAACCRVAGAKAGAGGATTGGAAGDAAPGAAFLAVAAVAGLDSAFGLGTRLRAIGRGFGSGTFAQAWAIRADSPTANAKLAVNAVDRSAAARAEDFTAFLCGGESSDR